MFTFKEFAIKQDRTAMKVGTDGVLLGAWVNCSEQDAHILDIGTGSGLIALMLAQRVSNARIDAVEIDIESAEQATENIAESRWSERIDLYCVNISEFNNKIRYNLIVSNPPFFVDSLLPPDTKREKARHTTSLSFDALISSVIRLLAPGGRFALILPLPEMEQFKTKVGDCLFLRRECCVLSRENGDTKRIMCEFSNIQSSLLPFETLPIRKENSNDYTDDYKKITADFYLKF